MGLGPHTQHLPTVAHTLVFLSEDEPGVTVARCYSLTQRHSYKALVAYLHHVHRSLPYVLGVVIDAEVTEAEVYAWIEAGNFLHQYPNASLIYYPPA